MKNIFLIMFFFAATSSAAQKVVFPPLCKAELSIANHSSLHHNTGNGVYIRCKECAERGEQKIYSVDTMNFIIIRNGVIIESGKMPGFISIKFNEKLKAGDIIVYSDFKSKQMQVSEWEAIMVNVPALKQN